MLGISHPRSAEKQLQQASRCQALPVIFALVSNKPLKPSHRDNTQWVALSQHHFAYKGSQSRTTNPHACQHCHRTIRAQHVLRESTVSLKRVALVGGAPSR
jgi:glutaredoxin